MMAKRRTPYALMAAVGAAAILALARNSVSTPTDQQAGAGSPARNANLVVDCAAPGREISPLIYGVGGEEPGAADLGAASRRWGGNPTTRYNWQLNTVNLTKDWFFKNTGGSGGGYRHFLDENRKQRLSTAFTVPTIGWVAKDATSYGFPVSAFGPQQATAPESADIGNGISPQGKPIDPGPPTITSVASTPESIERWVRQIRSDGGATRLVDSYILDNEPMLWNVTHRDVHPAPTTYDELLEKTIAYASAIRRADPDAKIAGPAEWGWQAYNYSAKDVADGLFRRSDRRAHGDEPLLPWYLHRLKEESDKRGTRLLDIVDVHYYPMGDGVGIGRGGKTDPATAALRIRSTRGLWDPTYLDESWIAAKTRVLPLLREWIDANYPGLRISIGEWNFGAEGHMSGGLATAEVLGHFGLEGVYSAFYWTIPPPKSPAFWAFRAFRNYDGAGGRFLDWSAPVTGSATLLSAFASRDADRHRVTLVLLNESALTPATAAVTVRGCTAAPGVRAYTYTGGDIGFAPLTVATSETPGSPATVTVGPYTITVLDFGAGPRR
jgi:Glycoside hydrolase family 44